MGLNEIGLNRVKPDKTRLNRVYILQTSLKFKEFKLPSNTPKTSLNILWTLDIFETPLKLLWNTMKACYFINLRKPFKLTWNTRETVLNTSTSPETFLNLPQTLSHLASLKLPWNTLETPLRLFWDIIETSLKLSWNFLLTSLKHPWNTLETFNPLNSLSCFMT